LESLQTRKARLERVIEVRTEQVEEDD
jgi:hypothetical protein